jgi:hypothetical protein
MFDSGLNVAWAAGPTRRLGSSATDSSGQSTGHDVGAFGYFRVGYAF